MTFNEWSKYAKVGSTCEYDDRTNQFIEQYNNATFQTYMDNERKNRAIQRANQIREKGGKFYLPTATQRVVQFNFTRDPITKSLYFSVTMETRGCGQATRIYQKDF